MYRRLVFALSCVFLPLSLHSALSYSDENDGRGYCCSLLDEFPPFPNRLTPLNEFTRLDDSLLTDDLPQKILSRLLEVAEDVASEYNVREGTYRKLVGVVQRAPKYAEQVLPVLLKVTGDKDEDLRWFACDALGELVRATAPDILWILIRVTAKSRDQYVHKNTSELLVWLLQVAPEHTAKVLQLLIEAAGDENIWVRKVAHESLKKLAQATPEHIPRLC